MGSAFPSSTINDVLMKAQQMGVDIQSSLANISYIEQNPTPYIYSSLYHENQLLAKKLIDVHTADTTNDKKAQYMEEQIIGIQWFRNYLIYVYYGVAILFLMVAYMRGMIQGIFGFIGFGLLLAFYPWIALYIESGLLMVWKWLGSVLFSNPYVMPQQLFVFQRPGSD